MRAGDLVQVADGRFPSAVDGTLYVYGNPNWQAHISVDHGTCGLLISTHKDEVGADQGVVLIDGNLIKLPSWSLHTQEATDEGR
jgi:hypothetical protein